MKSNTIKMSLIRKVKSPNRAHSYDAGIDFFVPEELLTADFNRVNPNMSGVTLDNTGDFIQHMHMQPNSRVLIPSGVCMNVPEGYALVFMNKSGVSTKKGLIVGGCVVDAEYQGEVHLSLINSSDSPTTISKGDKIVQGVILPVGLMTPEIVDLNELFETKSVRGSNGFGSTDKK